jgi:hypothetical protein
MLENIRARNHTALAMLVVGKLFGIGGLVVGSKSRVLGGTLLALDGVLIVAAILVAIATMKARTQEDDQHKAMLRQMKNEGTLKQYLRDLEAEEAASKDAAS